MIPETPTIFKQLTRLVVEERFLLIFAVIKILKIYKNQGNVYTLYPVMFEVFMAVTLKSTVIWVFMSVTVKSAVS
jgi:hypothetical protein